MVACFAVLILLKATWFIDWLLECPQNYISNYTGHTKIERLIFIADRAAGTPLELDALRLAAQELRNKVRLVRLRTLVCFFVADQCFTAGQTQDCTRYHQLCEKITTLGGNFPADLCAHFLRLLRLYCPSLHTP